jgi:hypothetical protein
MGRFVRPETCILTLANGEQLTVKKRLSSGEQRAAFARMYLAATDGTLHVNPLEMGLAVVTAYLVDWSFTDDGTPVRIRGLSVDELTSVLDSLSPEDFADVRTAIEAHAAAMTQEREEKKRMTAGTRADAATLPSPSGPAGPSIPSETLM